MKRGVWMRRLKHVPVWQDVKVLGEERVVSVAEDMPGMGGGDFREEVWQCVILALEVK